MLEFKSSVYVLISRVTTKRKGKKIEEKWDNKIFLINKNTRKKLKMIPTDEEIYHVLGLEESIL